MEKVRLNDLTPVIKREGLEGKKIYDKETAQAMVITIEPGYELAPHITPVDIFMFVLEGKGLFTIGDETLELTRDELVEGPVEIPHGIKNSGDEPLRVLVLKAPRP